MVALYNEIDPFAAAWLRELIGRNLIAPGDVAECSIEDLSPDDVRKYTQFHAFAGIGVWSYALRRAGWSDDRPIWTMSCPCQPFSAAGKGGGFDDERHLWPAAHYLIEKCGPPVVAGEQVASKDGLAWLDLVQADLEGTGYAFGAADTCSAGFGAPHIRQRLYWIGERLEHAARDGRQQRRAEPSRRGASSGRSFVGVADANHASEHALLRDGSDDPVENLRGGAFGGLGERLARRDESEFGGLGHDDDARLEGHGGRYQAESGWIGEVRSATAPSELGGMADADGRDASAEREQRGGQQRQQPEDGGAGGMANANGDGPLDGVNGAQGWGSETTSQHCSNSWPGPTNGFWGDVDWLHCRDGKWRPVEPGTFPLAHGAPARVGRLRGYGNAINAEAAVGFIEAYLETQDLEIAPERVRLEGAFA